ncbi:MAG: hypothetical protein ACJAS4_003093 [Bacteriovoracaceae bacterium]|jgi:hypothetical protein
MKLTYSIFYFLISSFILSNVYSSNNEEPLDNFSIRLEREIEDFEKSCIGKQEQLLKTKILFTSLTDCETEAHYLEEQINLYQKAVLESEELENMSTCKPNTENQELSNLINIVDKVTPQVSCTPEEVKANNDSCGKVWTCNALRSVFKITQTVVPKILAKPIRNFVKEKTESIQGGCMDEGKSDCLQELVNTLAGSLLDTGKALWELAKAGASSIFNVSDWFSSKSESMHTAAVQNTESVKSFLDSPGEWIMDLLSSMSSSMNAWVKSSVLCQEWSGEPHLSECVTPLASYDCIDCESQVNAVCSVAGAVISEIGIMALTAGAGNIASIGVRAGAASMRAIAKKAATKIKIKSPNIDLNIKKTKLMENPIVAGIVTKTTGAISITAKVAKEKLKSVKDFLSNVQKSRGVKVARRVASKTLDIIADPTRIGKVVAEKTFVASNKVVSSMGPKSMAKIAEKDIKTVKVAKKRGKRGKTVIKEKTRPSKVSSTIKIHKGVKGLKAKTSKQNDILKDTSNSGNHNDLAHNTNHKEGTNDSGSGSKIESKKISEHKQQEKDKDSNLESSKKHHEEDEEKHASNSQRPVRGGTLGGVLAQGNGLNLGQLVGIGLTGVGLDISKKMEDASEKEDARQSQSKSGGKAQGAYVSNGNKDTNLNKNKSKSKAETSNEMRARIEERLGKTEIENEAQLHNVLGLSGLGNSGLVENNDTAREKAETLSQIYSENNRSRMVQSLQAQNENLNREDAQRLFDQRQAQVKSANQFLKATSTTQKKSSRNEVVKTNNQNEVPKEFNQNSTSTKNVSKKSGISDQDLAAEVRELRGQITELDQQKLANIKAKYEGSSISSKSPVSKTKKGSIEPRVVYRGTNSSSLGSTGPEINSPVYFESRESEEKEVHALGTYHPDVLKNQGADKEAGENKREIASVSETSKDEIIPNRDGGFDKLNNLFEEQEKKIIEVSKVSNVTVNVNLAQVQSNGDVNRLLAFRDAIKRFKKASRVDTLQDDENTYNIYKFTNEEIFGIVTDARGGQRLLSDIEIKDLF